MILIVAFCGDRIGKNKKCYKKQRDLQQVMLNKKMLQAHDYPAEGEVKREIANSSGDEASNTKRERSRKRIRVQGFSRSSKLSLSKARSPSRLEKSNYLFDIKLNIIRPVNNRR